jgi:tryptophan-rich sensory protein
MMKRNEPRFKWVSLLAFLFVVLAVGFTIGLTIRPGEWYQALAKPFFTPPNWVFGPIWTIVYILIAIAGWRAWLKHGARTFPFALWMLQMVLNWAWTPLFFGAQQIALGLFIILLLLVVAVLFTVRAHDRQASLCFIPYIAWLIYASALNLAIFVLN